MNVVILDTGCANLSSVKYAVQRLGYEPDVSRDPEVVLLADKLFLPGVGTDRSDQSLHPASIGYLSRYAVAGLRE
jgi:imidazoleglycerol phosphate synthase glutamine amidotransferase subunit HisH